MTTRETGDFIIAVVVEGLGNTAGGVINEQYRFATRDPGADIDPNGSYITALRALPGVIDASVDFREGTSSTGGQTFELEATSQIRGFFCRFTPPAKIGLAAASVAAGATSVQININSNLTPSDFNGGQVVFEREVIRLGTGAGTNPTTYTGCQRGRVGTADVAHNIGARNGSLGDPQIFLASHFPVQLHRRVRVVRLNLATATGLNDEETLFRGVLRQVTMPDLETVSLAVDDLWEVVRSTRILARQWVGRLAYGSTFKGPGAPHTDDSIGAGVGDCAFALDDSTAVFARWAGDLTQYPSESDVVIDVDTTRFISGCPVIDSEEIADVKEIREVLTTHPDAPRINDSGDRLGRVGGSGEANGVDAIRQILQSSEAGTWGARGPNGSYDLGWRDLGCGLSDDDLDTTTFDAIKLALGRDVYVPDFFITEPTNAGEVIKRLCQIMGLALVRGAGAKLALARYSPVAPTGSVAITQSDIGPEVSVRVDPRRERVFDVVTVEIAGRPGVEALKQEFTDAYVQRRTPAARGTTEALDLRGLGEPGDDLSALTEGRRAVLRYIAHHRYPAPHYEFRGLPSARLAGLTEGESVTLTHELIPGVDGGQGITAQSCQVVSKSYDLRDHSVDLVLEGAGYARTRDGVYAPAGEIQSLGGGAATLGNDFSSSLLDGQTNDAFGFEAGMVAAVYTRDRSTKRGSFTITAVNQTLGTITATFPGGTSVGDLIEIEDYDSAGSTSQTKFAFLAGSDDTVGTSEDNGYQWV